MKTNILFVAIFTTFTFNLFSQIINIPNDYPTIQQGIMAAANGDTVLVAEGIYFENIIFHGKAITVASNYIIDNDTAHISNTVIDGSLATNPDSTSTVMFIHSEDTTSILSGFTIQGGGGMLAPGNKYLGGGICAWEAGAKITNNIVLNNEITTTYQNCAGGGISCAMGSGEYYIVIENNIIRNNSCLASSGYAFGGGVYVRVAARIKNNTIDSNYCYNTVSTVFGGGIAVVEDYNAIIDVDIQENIIRYNIIEGVECYGAGISVDRANVTINNNNIYDNTCNASSYAYGGGISTWYANEINVLNNQIYNNLCSSVNSAYGGGITTLFANTLQLTNNQIINNYCTASSAWGGGLFSDATIGFIKINDNNISNNEMTCSEYWFGAGIWIQEFSEQIQITKNQLKNNGGNEVLEWSIGGAIGIFNSGNSGVTMKKNILSNNYSDQGAGLWSFNVFNFTISNNIFIDNIADHQGGGILFRENLGNNEKTIFSIGINQAQGLNQVNAKELNYPVLINNAFYGNEANIGGAIYNDHENDPPLILNSVFWENTADTGIDIYNTSEIPIVISYSDINTSSILTPWTGNNNIFANPEFVDDSCHIADSSPCIEAGINLYEYNDTIFSCPESDIDDELRPLNNTADIGVDEVLISNICKPGLRNSNFISYPNPFASSTTIEFTLKDSGLVSLKVFDFTGKYLLTLLSDQLEQGNHQITWDAERLKTGVYYIHLEVDGLFDSMKIVLFGQD